MAAMTTTDKPMATNATAPADAAGEAAVAAAERRVHAAECWLHATRQSGIDKWVAGASAMLHEAVEEFFCLGGAWSRP
jgi:hypothetical protein